MLSGIDSARLRGAAIVVPFVVLFAALAIASRPFFTAPT